MQHSGQLNVRCVARFTPGTLHAVDARDLPTHRGELTGGPLVERILVDDDPLLGVLAFDLLLGANQSRHVPIASSILG